MALSAGMTDFDAISHGIIKETVVISHASYLSMTYIIFPIAHLTACQGAILAQAFGPDSVTWSPKEEIGGLTNV